MHPASQTIAVIGAGTMGSGIAHVCALAGLPVLLHDPSEPALDHALATIRHNLARQLGKAPNLTPEQITTQVLAALNRITFTTTLEDLAPATLAIEAAPERLEIKLDLFRTLDRLLAPAAILASNTSSISITKLAAATSRPEQVIGMHFFNPVPVMKLIEVIRGLQTSQPTFETVHALALHLGKTPVEVNDSPGFISNRVLMPLLNEAAYAVMEGVATAEAVDQIFTLGMAHPMGPLKLADFIGLDVCLDICRVLESAHGEARFRPCPLLVRMVDAGWLGRKSGRGFYTY
jgi:3-hydroxybutyryl-CoA dehydrogenase